MTTAPHKVPVVLPVGGGKGGIGKSTVAASLALALARLEHGVTLVDADLGGSDLHNLLGLPNDLVGLGEVLTANAMPLAEAVHQVLDTNLAFIPGDALMVATANPSFQKKRKLLHSIKKLSTPFVLLDLGAGAAITVMDFFLTSPLSILVMLPERPALLNAFNFLKNAVFRAMDRVFRGNSRGETVLAGFRRRGRGPGAMRMADLVSELAKTTPEGDLKAGKVLKRFKPKLLLNRVRRMDDFVYARQMERWAADDLGLGLETVGFLPEDDVLGKAAAAQKPALDFDPRAPFCQALTLVALDISRWAGRAAEWADFGDTRGGFERAATRFAPYFPPPGTALPTRDELLRKLKELEARLKD